MNRVLFELVPIFLSPFLLFWLYRLLRPDTLEGADASNYRTYGILALAGLLLIVGYLVVDRVVDPRHTGAYHPARVENGVLVPGKVE